MLRVLSSIYKETLVIIRDRAGLALLFVMPAVLILIMTILQDATYKTVKENKIAMVFVDNDKDSLGIAVRKGLEQAKIFTIVDEIEGIPVTEETAQEAIASGDYKIGIVIPAFSTQAIRNNVNLLINKSFDIPSLPGQKNRQRKNSVEVKIYIDPVTSNSFINSVMSSLKEFTAKLEIQLFFKNFSHTMTSMFPDRKPVEFDSFETIRFTEIYASTSNSAVIPNSVQHNVPAWTMFAMFFIVLPLAGNMINERKEGSAVRLKTMPGSYMNVLGGKVFVFLIVAMLQFIMMILIGKYIMPLIGLPKLMITGGHLAAALVVAFVSGLAATGYGVAIGTIATTHEQAATFGAVSVIILAALGGIWVPEYIMPGGMQIISKFSPLNWGLSGFYDIFIRNESFISVLQEIGKLLSFFVFCILVAFTYNKLKRSK